MCLYKLQLLVLIVEPVLFPDTEKHLLYMPSQTTRSVRISNNEAL